MTSLNFPVFSRNYKKYFKTIKELVIQIDNVDTGLITSHKELHTLLNQLDSKYHDFVSFCNPYLQAEKLPGEISEDDLVDKLTEIESLYLKGSKSAKLILDDYPQDTTQKQLAPLNASLVSLPKFTIPTFSGKFQDWEQFHSHFKSLIDSNSSLSPAQKFQYLVQGLDSSTQHIISHLPLIDENYKIALDLLTKRYYNPRRQTSLYCDKLLNLPLAELKSATSIRTLLDTLNVNLNALKTSSNQDPFETIFTFSVLSKLDAGLKLKFEETYLTDVPSSSTSSSNSLLPSLSSVIDFLTSSAVRKETVYCLTDPKSSSRPGFKPNSYSRPRKTSSLIVNSPIKCHICNKNHLIYKCPTIQGKSPRDRYTLIKEKSLCLNCLRPHPLSKCPSTGVCGYCAMKHHSLLCFGSSKGVGKSNTEPSRVSDTSRLAPSTTPNHASSSPLPSSVTLSSNHPLSDSSPSVLMATCLIKLQVSPNQYIIARAILDSASHASFITERCAQLLSAKRCKTPFTISGVGQTAASSNGSTFLTIQTLSGELVSSDHPFIIMPKITSNTPGFPVPGEVKNRLKHFVLADPTYHVNSRIDCLLNADITVAVLAGKPISLGPDLPYAVPTQFGYVVMGNVPSHPTLSCNLSCVSSLSPKVCDPINKDLMHFNYHQEDPTPSVVALTVSPLDDLNETIKAFWQIEEPPSQLFLSEEDQACETLFASSTVRDETGRYCVRLPFREYKELGNSYDIALRQLLHMERKFNKNPTFHSAYLDFMQDLKQQGHMRPVGPHEPSSYFIPHHGVFKTHGDTSKIRVVFNASCKTSNGKSLNDILLPGPKLQTLITDVITLFRKYPLVFSCDIEQMFRQISLNPLDQPYQCILWRDSPQDPVQLYYLTTVIYGLSSSPYLALKTLRQLAQDEGSNYPHAALALQESSFVDDIFVGASSLETARQLKDELIALLRCGGFTLKKWSSNHPALLNNNIDPEQETFSSISPEPVNVLGLLWDTHLDQFSLRIPPSLITEGNDTLITKRVVLSKIAQLYDPCGWIAPVVMKAKIFMQALWLEPLDWDTPIPDHLSDVWKSLVLSFDDLKSISISRPLSPNATTYQLHGFCDACKTGYGACLYLRSITPHGQVTITLLVAKTKVAPLKVINIPRLELLGAFLLANLVGHYLPLLKSHFSIESIYLWSDSSIVLNWIKIPPYKLKTFVANRVSTIQNLTSTPDWHHISSIDNPADAASRGLAPSELINHPCWWNGPPWLAKPESEWPTSTPADSCPDTSLELVSLVSANKEDFLSNVSSWDQLLKRVSLICKFLYHSKQEIINSVVALQSRAIICICRHIQLIHFPDVRHSLERNKVLPKWLQYLTPFMDKHGLIRVGGRLANSPSSPHPILLPKNHPFVHLLINYYHMAHGHAGPSFVQYQLSLKYWILSARQTIRSQLLKCIRCFKVQPLNQTPLMGNLPVVRTTPSPPFFNAGMDFAGPFNTKAHDLRKSPLIKTYMCIFICFATKAVHIEAAQDLSAAAFLDVLQRFISRRSAPQNLYSDCGTNFVGAAGQLNKQWQQCLLAHKTKVEEFCCPHKIHFHFLPPAAPHQGGLWERAVRSAKYHFYRVLGTQVPTLFQLNSLFIRIECILNSRPLYPMSSNPNDLRPLTPAHFLVGRPLVAPPEPDCIVTPNSSLKHYGMVQALIQQFWNRWRSEYLPGLHARAKWFRPQPNLEIDDLVVVEHPNAPPLSWPLGRVCKVFPGQDGTVRKAEVRTATGLMLRPAVRLYRLPIKD